jgi:hypothetical protein
LLGWIALSLNACGGSPKQSHQLKWREHRGFFLVARSPKRLTYFVILIVVADMQYWHYTNQHTAVLLLCGIEKCPKSNLRIVFLAIGPRILMYQVRWQIVILIFLNGKNSPAAIYKL